MRLPRDPSPELPACPCAGVDGKGAGGLPLGEAKLTALGDQPTGKFPLIDVLRVIAQESDKGRDETNFGPRLPCLPVVNRPSERYCRARALLECHRLVPYCNR